MLESIAGSVAGSAAKTGSPVSLNAGDVAQFQQMLGANNQALGAVQSFVAGAESRLERGQLAVSGKLKNFDYRDNVMGLVYAMHESSMNSVSVQLTGKIGTKVSESFESLIKQQ